MSSRFYSVVYTRDFSKHKDVLYITENHVPNFKNREGPKHFTENFLVLKR